MDKLSAEQCAGVGPHHSQFSFGNGKGCEADAFGHDTIVVVRDHKLCGMSKVAQHTV